MKKECREIVDMIAEGEAFGDEHEDHIANCLTCARTLETRNLIRATTARRNQVQPRPGFASRAAAAALERSGKRRRRGTMVLGAAAVAATAVTVAFFMMDPQPIDVNHAPTVATATQPGDTAPGVVDTTSVIELLDLSDVEAAMAIEADWDWLQEPLAAVRLLAEQVGSDEE